VRRGEHLRRVGSVAARINPGSQGGWLETLQIDADPHEKKASGLLT
jgi:hypothetical protein